MWRFNKMMLMAFCAVALGAASSCPPRGSFPEPDLIPEGRSGAQGPNAFCDLNDDGDLMVKVRNQTSQDVLVPTQTTVTFFPGGPFTQTAAPMPAGSPFSHTFQIPPGCFNPDCDFKIEVDSGDDVDESHGPTPDNHETNNIAEGICIG